MKALETRWGHLHVRDDGVPDGPAMIFANSLGTDLRMWDDLLPRLPRGFRFIRLDTRGHGLSAVGPAGFSIEDLAKDVLSVLDELGIVRAVAAGSSLGGMVMQSLAATQPDRVAGLVLMNTAPKIGTPAMWHARVEQIRAGGLAAIAPAVLERWFAPAFRETVECRLWQTMLTRCDADGYIACCAAIAAADLTPDLPRIQVPALVVAGGLDGATPPEQVLATARSIAGVRTGLIEEAGHLPAIEAPGKLAAMINDFLQEARLV